MSVGKLLVAFMAICCLAILIVGCAGNKGPDGPPGYPGDDGPPGQNRVADPISDRTFGILIANGSASDLVGAPRVRLTSDTTATPSDSVVVARVAAKSPIIDGVDGVGEWGAPASTITLDSIAGYYNGIAAATVRVAYDRSYVYMQVMWTEVAKGEEPAAGSFTTGADITKGMWTYTSSGSHWSQSGGEDLLYVAWEITAITGWSAKGVDAVFDGVEFRAPVSGEKADLWAWLATQTNYTGYLADKVVGYAASGDGSSFDMGPAPMFVLANLDTLGRPKYMKSGSTTSGSSYPLRSYEFTKFNTAIKWQNGATIPGYVSFVPSGSLADVQVGAGFSGDTWTVELRRLRETGNADDAKF